MGWPAGGSQVAGAKEELRQALYNFYGALNEVKALSESNPTLVSSVKVPDKPEAMVLWEQCQAFSLPLVEGGLLDQPHLWLEEVAVLKEVREAFSRE